MDRRKVLKLVGVAVCAPISAACGRVLQVREEETIGQALEREGLGRMVRYSGGWHRRDGWIFVPDGMDMADTIEPRRNQDHQFPVVRWNGFLGDNPADTGLNPLIHGRLPQGAHAWVEWVVYNPKENPLRHQDWKQKLAG